MTEDTFIIPIDNALTDFMGHMESNPRTIFSSKFGDGKSFFLQKLEENEEAQSKFEFITLYPVNYQVIENKDIFDLIKVDLLFQLFCHNMISDRIKLRDDVALSFFIQKKGLSLAEELLPYLAELALSHDDCNKVLLAFKGLKLFKDLKDKYIKYKEYSNEDAITKYIDKVNSSTLYENDVVTKIIRDSIVDYKRRTGKRVVLIIEDLDRIDPAHLFRILNVLSAHIDSCYRYSLEPQEMIGNKFELDNIVLVIDYSNLRHIFHHFYGEETDFNGYISKFISSTPFHYSLKDVTTSYYLNEIGRITGAPQELIKYIDVGLFERKTIREAVNAFNIRKQIVKEPVYKSIVGEIHIDTTILKVLALMRRLKMTDSSLVEFVCSLEKNDVKLFCRYVCPYVFLIKNNTFIQDFVLLKPSDTVISHEVHLVPANGQGELKAIYSTYDNSKSAAPVIANYLLTYIRR